jgi:1-aminocyclopropane-1-carboxylate deaminase
MLPIRLNHLLQKIDIPQQVRSSVLRLDLIDTTISGNKLFKLQYYIEDAINNKCTTIITFGGVWSNHIIATAALCKKYQLNCIGYIRSDENLMTATLVQAKAYGMQLIFCTRTAYKELKYKTGVNSDKENTYYIGEGGLSVLGVKGASNILNIDELSQFTQILCCVGTGTTFAGIVNASLPHQQIIGINALKGGSFQLEEIKPYLKNNNYKIMNEYHFGGFAKYTNALIDFMNNWYQQTKIPTDIVYTAKLFWGYFSLVENQYFTEKDNILIIHSGGLQGNQSLSQNILKF